MDTTVAVIEKLAELVRLASVSSLESSLDRSNVAVASRIAEYANDLGAKVDLLELGAPYPGKVNVVATWGRGEDALILSGHTDTVPAGTSGWNTDPYQLKNDGRCLYGLGACDMKSFFSLAFAAIEMLGGKALSEKLKRPIVLIGTANEECDMAGARALLDSFESSQVRLGRYAIIGEPTRGVPIRMHKGVAFSEITLRGKSGHSSMPHTGLNALAGMRQVLGELQKIEGEIETVRHSGFAPPYSTINLGRIEGGDAPNRICESCTLQFDTRIVPGMAPEPFFADLDARVLQIAKAGGFVATSRRITSTVAPFETASKSAIVQAVEELTGAQSTSVPFATEGPFFSEMGIETVVFGPGDIAVAHQPNEHLEIATLAPYVDKLARLIQTFTLE